jgi:glycosyltransferase involved in cell wall biosynthesis
MQLEVGVPKMIRKTLIISEWAPPMVGGGPTIMRSLFRHFSPDSYVILMSDPLCFDGKQDMRAMLGGKYYFNRIPKIAFRLRKSRFYRSLWEIITILFAVFRGVNIIRTERVQNILATTYGGYEVAALILHKIMRKKLFVYLFDIYEESQLSFWGKFKARLTEPPLLKSASRVFVMSEPLQEHIKKKYGDSVRTTFLPHALDTQFKFRENIASPSAHKTKAFTIIYTGMIYEAHYDSVVNMSNVVNSFPEGEMVFEIYTPRPKEALTKRGICGKNITQRFVSLEEMPNILQKADVLFLPFAFNSPYPLVIHTASPGKIAEYLAAARPILVHAPEYAYISSYAKSGGFGLVVDKPDPISLRNALIRLRDDKNLREELVRNASLALLKHDGRIISNKLKEVLYS